MAGTDDLPPSTIQSLVLTVHQLTSKVDGLSHGLFGGPPGENGARVIGIAEHLAHHDRRIAELEANHTGHRERWLSALFAAIVVGVGKLIDWVSTPHK